MKFCPQCGTQTVDEARFCISCGSEFPAVARGRAGAPAQQPAAAARPTGAQPIVRPAATRPAETYAPARPAVTRPAETYAPASPAASMTAADRIAAAMAAPARGRGQASASASGRASAPAPVRASAPAAASAPVRTSAPVSAAARPRPASAPVRTAPPAAAPVPASVPARASVPVSAPATAPAAAPARMPAGGYAPVAAPAPMPAAGYATAAASAPAVSMPPAATAPAHAAASVAAAVPATAPVFAPADTYMPASVSAPTAPVGVSAPTAPVGVSAPTGPVGFSAPTGPVGVSAPTGPVGVSAPTGPVGVSAPTGPVGVSAPTAPVGISAPTGPVGVSAPAAAAAVAVPAAAAAGAYVPPPASTGVVLHNDPLLDPYPDRFNFGDIYLVQLIKKIMRRSNWGLAVYLLINQMIICMPFALICNHAVIGILIGIVLNLIVITAVLSPFGEWYLRSSTQCGVVDEDSDVYRRIHPIFEAAHQRARLLDPNVPEHIDLFFHEDDSMNAFATGRHTMCINTGLLRESDEVIYGVMGHELGHLAHQDTDDFALITSGNFFINLARWGTFLGMEIMVFIMTIVAAVQQDEEGMFMLGITHFSRAVMIAIDFVLMTIWGWLGILLVRKTSREQEFEADAFSAAIGGGPGLLKFFETYGNADRKEKGLLKMLQSDHPADHLRIERIKACMAAAPAIPQGGEG